jgi:hypothetical protein
VESLATPLVQPLQVSVAAFFCLLVLPARFFNQADGAVMLGTKLYSA